MVHRKFTFRIYNYRGSISFWHNPENGGGFGGFPEQMLQLLSRCRLKKNNKILGLFEIQEAIDELLNAE